MNEPTVEEALRMTAQALAWQCFGECRGWHDRLPAPQEALEAAKAALGVNAIDGSKHG
jgi:hypothetical protein